ncbi:MAG: hypothetical protein H6Q89_1227 [Myxococcaceae bacterium]|nr:hypothetical protein [Myxococcaceae bacterium]
MLDPRRLLCASALLLSAAAFAQSNTCEPTASVPLERQLRQLTLDLLGRPPTIAEYRAAVAKGSISQADIQELMGREEFYGRMKTYHRALFRSNVTATVYNNGDFRVLDTTDGARPLESRGNPSVALRGRNGQGCDHFIPQDDCKNATLQQDPQMEGAAAAKQCRDLNGVPLPVSVDYDTTIFACTALTGATSCSGAVTAGLLEDKYLNFCDMRRVGANLAPFKCVPDPAKPATLVLTQEVLDANGRVTAFAYPTPPAGAIYTQLDKCSLTLGLRSGVRGSYAPARGCIQREGWVMADAPFWDTSGAPQVAACAIEAQQRAVNPATMTSCEAGGFMNDRSCGCGLNFRRCESGNQSVHNARIAAINEEPLLIADSVLRRDEDYFTILSTRRSFINGPLSAFYRGNQGIGVLSISLPVEKDVIPAIPYTADPAQFTEYIRGENASGVLTTPSFLYRFPTFRARVAEFYEAFLCKSFVPPADAIAPNPEDGCNRENNLAKRCGCNYCHATIEPTGAHWGRYGERNAQFLAPEIFPKYDAKCRDCALAGNVSCDGECGNYVMQAYDGDGANSLGLLKTYLYRTPEEEPNIVGGPKLLVERMLQTGDLERCSVKRVWREFTGRPMSVQEEELYLQPMVEGFVKDGHNLKALIQHVVTSDAYRRID